MKFSSIRSLCLALLTILISMISFATAAYADPAAALKRAATVSAEAMAAYDDFEIEDAEAKILQAIEIVENGKVTDPNVATIYIANGVISYNRWKDSALTIAENRAYVAFLKAVALNNNIEIPSDYRSTEIDAILDRAKNDIAMGSAAATSVVAVQKPSLTHVPLPSSNRCAPLKLNVKAGNNNDVYHVSLFYQSDDQVRFETVDMVEDHRERGTFYATIPGAATRGSNVRYYIEAVNKDGEHAGSVGSNFRPITTSLTGECVGLTDDDLSIVYGDPSFQLNTMIGTGIGIVRDGIRLQRSGDSSTAGAAWSPLFIRVGALFNLPANLQAGIYLRGQIVDILGNGDRWISEGNNKAYPSLMIGATLRWFALSRQPYRLYVGLEAGWGGASAQVKSKSENKTDIYLFEGQGHITPEIGFLWTLHKNVGLVAELAVPIHFPKDASAHIDISVGPFFQF